MVKCMSHQRVVLVVPAGKKMRRYSVKMDSLANSMEARATGCRSRNNWFQVNHPYLREMYRGNDLRHTMENSWS